jgi:hypothetical protein
MSAVIAFKTEDGVILFTDMAVYDDHYVMRDLRRKVAVARSVPLAVATRGSEGWCQMVSDTLIEWADSVGVDEAIETFAACAGRVYRFDAKAQNRLEVTIACLSPTAGPRLMAFRNAPGGDRPVGILEEIGSYYLGCATDGSATPNPRRQLPGEGVVSYAADIGVSLMEHFRRQAIPPADWDVDDRPKFVIGGGVDMTIVNTDGVSVKRIVTWPDRIGEMIDPYAEGNIVPFGVTSRQQRRAAPRAARRSA